MTMLDKTFEKFGELFETFEQESDAFFKRVEEAFEKGRQNDDIFGSMPFWTTKTTTFQTSPQKFEYKVVELHTFTDVEAGLNLLGEDGWQMVHNDGGKVTFMREIHDEE
jgi:hypothetical protein